MHQKISSGNGPMRTMADQTTIFEAGEGDAWFHRNVHALSSDHAHDPATELALKVIRESGGAVNSVCEVGCANGWRLAALASEVDAGTTFAGFDVSADAVADGKGRWPHLDLRVGSAHRPPFDRSFDLIIANFILHWVDRARLAGTLAAMDQLLSDNGYLIVADFLPAAPCRTAYHHLPHGTAYTYKQDYREAFLGLGFYHQISAEAFDHGAGTSDAEIPEQDRAVCALLRKSFSTYRLADRA